MTKESNFKKELTSLINRYSRENKSNTPDFILAEYMNECLLTFEHIIVKRDEWHDFGLHNFSDILRNQSGNEDSTKL